MSAGEVRYQIGQVQKLITDSKSRTFSTAVGKNVITTHFLSGFNLLLQKYGEFIGKAKAKHSDHLEQINEIDGEIKEYFDYLVRTSEAYYSFKLMTLGIRKISEIVSFIEGLETIPPEKKVSRIAYEKMAREKEALEKAIEIMAKFGGRPELNKLLENARDVGLPTDENWVLALCSTNLIEAVVNKKLEQLKAPTEGNFKKKYKRLLNLIKEKEQRDIQQLLPLALYEGIRNKLDHASHTNRVTPKEAKQISKLVIDIITEVFQ